MSVAPRSARGWSIDEDAIRRSLASATMRGTARAREALDRAREQNGLACDDVAALLLCRDPEIRAEMFETARAVKESIYGHRIVLFAPLYISNHCDNDCLYCAFRSGSPEAVRTCLSPEEMDAQVTHLLAMGHKRLLMVSGESPTMSPLSRVCEAIERVYSVRRGAERISRINVNVAPMSVEEFRLLRRCGIGTYQLFQETYHEETYRRVHRRGPKSDFHGRLTALHRAMEAGIDDVGMGALFGLHDPRFEVLAMLQHISHLESTHGIGPHTLSVPRMEPARGAGLSSRPPCPVSDEEFLGIIAILRLAVPYTGIILSTRESILIRTAALSLGVSQLSAGSSTAPGGYGEIRQAGEEQFQVGDRRSLQEVVQDLVHRGYIPSFCTACYRQGRTGDHFMDLARPGHIQRWCLPNALLTFQEYLVNHSTAELRQEGDLLVERCLEDIARTSTRQWTRRRLERTRGGERDLFL